MNGRITLILFMIVFTMGCEQERENEVYYPFQDNIWQRFNILSFEVPVEKSEKPYRIVFFARHNKQYRYNSLDFNMVMVTPSGEERINEYRLKIRNAAGTFLGTCEGEICEASIILKKEIYLNKSGTLIVELENLTPRIETPDLSGVGIRIEQLK